MKQTILLVSLAAAVLLAAPIDRGQRDFAVNSLQESRKAFLDSIAGLSEAQWKFKAAADRWSIAEVAEHVILTEDFLFGMEQKALKSPAVAERKVAREADEALLSQMADRTTKRESPPEVGPTGRYQNPNAAARAFKEARGHTLEYVRTTQDDLRAHVTTIGPVTGDAYQVFLMIAGHANRHVAQINEVKAAAGYPKK
jgi:hypothetical protein